MATQLDTAAVAFEIQVLKRLGYAPDTGNNTGCKLPQVYAFADANIPNFKAHIKPDQQGRKNKKEVMACLASFLRVQQPSGHWKDKDGKPHTQIIVPAQYTAPEEYRDPVPGPTPAPVPVSEPRATPMVVPVVLNPGAVQLAPASGAAVQQAAAGIMDVCAAVLPCAGGPGPGTPPEPAPAAPMEFTWIPELNAPGQQ